MDKSKDISIVTCFFNPCHYKKRLLNYNKFRQFFDQFDIEVLTVEGILGDYESELKDYSNVLTLSGGDVLWQKEKLLNYGARYQFERGYENVMFIDADSVFENDDWLDNIKEYLNKRDWFYGARKQNRIHPDRKLQSLDFKGKFAKPGTIGLIMSKSFFEKINGLYEYAIIGGGDVLMSLLLNNIDIRDMCVTIKINEKRYISGETSKYHYFLWRIERRKFIMIDNFFVQNKVCTFEHGRRKNRRYVDRKLLIKNFNPFKDLVEYNGMWKWTSHASDELKRNVKQYFYDRNEDEFLNKY